ncbi:MAG TPA: hypothetical protein VMF53_10230 [Alphaproteobacteria bacterium]|nr:hypothetical protein [Alphaproteobacteria bacterium]
MASSAQPTVPRTSGRGVTRLEALAFLAFVMLMAWPFGTYTRPPFDDEIFTLGYIHEANLRAIFSTGLTGIEIHPFFSYAWYRVLSDLGLALWAMRSVSLLLSASAFLFVLDLTLRAQAAPNAAARVSILFLFATFPLLYGVGDALRWYPILAFEVALFFRLELRRDAPTIAGGLLLGLAASTNYLAIFAYVGFAVRRYALKRRFELRADAPFHLAMLLTAWPGLVNFAMAFDRPGSADVSKTFLEHVSILAGLAGFAQAALGFFGGYRLGLFNGALALPFVALLLASLAALYGWLRRARGESASEDARDLVSVATTLIVLSALYSLFTSFDRGRALLFVAPFLLGCFALGYWRLKLAARWQAWPLAFVALLLYSAALGAGRLTDEPFKRDLAIPFDEVAQFVADNTSGDVLVASSEPVSQWLLEEKGYCTIGWGRKPQCLARGLAPFHDIVVVRNQEFLTQPRLEKIAREVAAERQLVARAEFGRDRTARLKTLLTGTPLSPWLVTVEIYR